MITMVLTDINECTENLDDCSDNANCVNLIGSFECLCLDGFRGDGRTCSGLMFAYIIMIGRVIFKNKRSLD